MEFCVSGTQANKNVFVWNLYCNLYKEKCFSNKFPIQSGLKQVLLLLLLLLLWEYAIRKVQGIQLGLKMNETYHYATSWKTTCLRSNDVNFFNLPNPSGCTKPWGSLSL
jgi:hypothetical protein